MCCSALATTTTTKTTTATAVSSTSVGSRVVCLVRKRNSTHQYHDLSCNSTVIRPGSSYSFRAIGLLALPAAAGDVDVGRLVESVMPFYGKMCYLACVLGFAPHNMHVCMYRAATQRHWVGIFIFWGGFLGTVPLLGVYQGTLYLSRHLHRQADRR